MNSVATKKGVKKMKKPNIILIMCDQLKVDTLGCYGNQVCKTPAIDSLAKDGVTFDQGYTTCPICSPARASIQNGLMPSRHGVTSNIYDVSSSVHELKDSPQLISRRLADDYSLGFIGKWHLGYGPRPEATQEEIGMFPENHVTEERSLPTLMGFEGHDFPGYGARWGSGGKEYEAFLNARNLEYKCIDKTPECDSNRHCCWGEVTSPVESTMDYFLVERTKELINDFTKRDKPFCVQTHFWGPHASATPPTEFLEKYKDIDIPQSPNFTDPLIDKPRIHNMWRRKGEKWPFFAEFIRYYWAYMESIDAQIGRYLDFLKENNLYDDAWIIFTADHGDSQGCHAGLENKTVHLYEETARIPIIIKPPAGTGTNGQRTQAPAGICDVYATIIDAADRDIISIDCDGESLIPVVKDPNTDQWRDFVVCEGAGVYGINLTQRMIRKDNLKYVFNAADTDELYDLQTDPYELTNLANKPEHQDTLKTMQQKLSDWMKDHHRSPATQVMFERIVGLR